jgi:small GTP-binding protein
MNSNPVRVVKVVLLGSSGVGKSSILHRYVSQEWETNPQTTLGAAFLDKKLTYEGVNFKFQIWDTAGQEKYAPLAQMYYRDAHVAILVYDMSNRDSLSTLKDWRAELMDKGPKGITLAIVGNKCDLENQRGISSQDGEKLAREYQALFAKTSAKENIGIDELFESICSHLLSKDMYSSTRTDAHKLTGDNKEVKGGCCG